MRISEVKFAQSKDYGIKLLFRCKMTPRAIPSFLNLFASESIKSWHGFKQFVRIFTGILCFKGFAIWRFSFCENFIRTSRILYEI